MKYLILFLLLVSTPASYAAMNDDELARAEALFKNIENSDSLIFIRNGTEYNSQKAADHLRLKLGKAKKKLDTLEEFIEKAGSTSSISGKPYLIKDKSTGEITPARQYLLDQIDK